MQYVDNLILGAGIAGLGASYALKDKGEQSLILEKDANYGGLCGSFSINGFIFDRFVHLSFSKEECVNNIFRIGAPEIIRHTPNPANIYRGKWIKHPALNNLYVLEQQEIDAVIEDFVKRPTNITEIPTDYEQWLRLQYGNYFAEHFPMVYTRKYWMKEAKELRTEWVGNRLYQPSLDEVISGSKKEDERITYYAKEMRYPAEGGFATYLKAMVEIADIRYNSKVVTIDTNKKIVTDNNGNEFNYTRLISSLPLPLVVSSLVNVPENIVQAASMLDVTSGYHVSVALKTNKIPPYLWWYIYDEEILATRVYSPSLKSPQNAPKGCSSLQMEVYCKEGDYTEQQLLDGTVGKIVKMGLINKEDILFTHIGFEPYANVIFTKPIYDSRKIVREYLLGVGIKTIGRFGEWDYFWSDQSLMSGLNVI